MRLAESFRADLLLERAEENPFLPRFYQNPEEAALPTQLHFLFQRVRQAQTVRQRDLFAPICVADFLLDKDRVFAELTLDPDELELYYRVYELLAPRVPTPDLVIYLQAPVETLLERIQRRGIEYERHISPSYLKQLADAYVEFFHAYQEAPLLIVNTSEVNLVLGQPDYALLLEQITIPLKGKRFFNPSL